MKPVEAAAAEASLWKRMRTRSQHLSGPWRSASLLTRDATIGSLHHESLATRQRNGERGLEVGGGGWVLYYTPE